MRKNLNDILNPSDFNRKGSLKSLINFSFCGEVSTVEIRTRKIKVRGTPEGKERESCYLLLKDSYGFFSSFTRPFLDVEKASLLANKIPIGRTIMLEGEIAITRGNTFFNVNKIKNPDDSDVFLLNEDQSDLREEA